MSASRLTPEPIARVARDKRRDAVAWAAVAFMFALIVAGGLWLLDAQNRTDDIVSRQQQVLDLHEENAERDAAILSLMQQQLEGLSQTLNPVAQQRLDEIEALVKELQERSPTGVTVVPGEPGIPGTRGPKGDKGDPGATGNTGATGATGATGEQGPPGESIVGPEGPPGEDGADGEDGTDGVGVADVSCSVDGQGVVLNSTFHFSFTLTDGSVVSVSCVAVEGG